MAAAPARMDGPRLARMDAPRPPQGITVTLVRGEDFLAQVDDLLSPEECRWWIDRINRTVTGSPHPKNKSWHPPGTGGSYDRVIRWEEEWAKLIWKRLQGVLPAEYEGYKPMYVNPCFRFSRYRNGGLFPVHTDGKNYDAGGPHGWATESLFTINIFLNHGFGGGSTEFFETAPDKHPWKPSHQRLRRKIEPKAGRAAVFWADQLHRGEQVRETVDVRFKYLMRTDVMGMRK